MMYRPLSMADVMRWSWSNLARVANTLVLQPNILIYQGVHHCTKVCYLQVSRTVRVVIPLESSRCQLNSWDSVLNCIIIFMSCKRIYSYIPISYNYIHITFFFFSMLYIINSIARFIYSVDHYSLERIYRVSLLLA